MRAYRHSLFLAITAALSACETQVAEVRRYSGTPIFQAVSLAKGDLAISNRNGGIWVDTAGTAGQITVIARPFANGGNDDEAAREASAAMATLTLSAAPDANGGIVVSGSGDDRHGMDLTVHLPYPFGGFVTVSTLDGYVHYVGSSGGRGATINVTKGDIFVQDGGKVLTVHGGQSNITVIALPTLTGTSITTDDGNVTAQIPDAANLLITASSASGGTVTPPPDRDVQATGDDDDSSSSLVVLDVAPDHKSATIQLGDLQTIQTLEQYLTVSTGHGNVVFR